MQRADLNKLSLELTKVLQVVNNARELENINAINAHNQVAISEWFSNTPYSGSLTLACAMALSNAVNIIQNANIVITGRNKPYDCDGDNNDIYKIIANIENKIIITIEFTVIFGDFGTEIGNAKVTTEIPSDEAMEKVINKFFSDNNNEIALDIATDIHYDNNCNVYNTPQISYEDMQLIINLSELMRCNKD